jgi:hypothetical protein
VRGRVWVLVGEANKDKNEAIGRPRNCWPDVWSVNSTKILLYLYLYNTCTYVLVLVRSNLDTVLVIVQYIQDVRVLVESVWSHFPHGVLTSDQESWLRGPVKTVNHSVEWFQNTISPTILLTLANASWYKYLIIVRHREALLNLPIWVSSCPGGYTVFPQQLPHPARDTGCKLICGFQRHQLAS